MRVAALGVRARVRVVVGLQLVVLLVLTQVLLEVFATAFTFHATVILRWQEGLTGLRLLVHQQGARLEVALTRLIQDRRQLATTVHERLLDVVLVLLELRLAKLPLAHDLSEAGHVPMARRDHQ